MTKSARVHPVSHWLPWLLLVVVIGWALPAVSAGLLAAGAGGEHASFAEALRARGWHSWRGEDGSLWFRPVARGSSAIAQQRDGRVKPAPSAAPAFARLMRQRGWQVRVDGSGTTWLTPVRKTGSVPADIPAEHIAQAHPAGRSAAPARSHLAHLLQRGGWSSRRGADGSLWLWRPQPAAVPQRQQLAVTAASSRSPICHRSMGLRSNGFWRIQRSSRGDVLLVPVRRPV